MMLGGWIEGMLARLGVRAQNGGHEDTLRDLEARMAAVEAREAALARVREQARREAREFQRRMEEGR